MTAPDRRLVSVLTPTWQRHDLLLEAIENVRQQSYRPLEHVVVSDGPDMTSIVGPCSLTFPLVQRHVESGGDMAAWFDDVPLRYVELGQHWTGILQNSYAAAPLQVAMFLARGAYHTWLADDERMHADHISSLVDLLEQTESDLAYSMAELRWRDDPGRTTIIGTDPPVCGQITNCLYRAELLRHGLYVFGNDRTADWETYASWLRAGARAVFLPRVTFTHRVDR